MRKPRHIGLNAARLRPERENPEEVRFAKAWQKHNEQGCTLDHLLDPIGSGRPAESTERDTMVAATVIQWLGSPVGQFFLKELGYEKKEK